MVMRGIKLRHGATFVECDGITLRYIGGKWESSPIMYQVLDWELRTAEREDFDYLTESDIRGMGEECYKSLLDTLTSIRLILCK